MATRRFGGLTHRRLHMQTRGPRIDAYRFGRVVIDGTPYEQDVILTPAGVQAPWRRRLGHVLNPSDLQALLDDDCEALVVGTGSFGRMKVAHAVPRKLAERGIELRAERTAQAVEIYRSMSAAGKKVTAALHLTC